MSSGARRSASSLAMAGTDAAVHEPGRAPWFRIASFPDRTFGNPHLDLFHGALEHHGVKFTGRLVCTASWIAARAGDLDAIHLHWPEKLWRGRNRGRLNRAVRVATLANVRGVLAFRRALRTAGRAGIKRVWTVHNLEPHEGAGWVDRWGYRIAAGESDLILCYSESAAARVRDLYGAGARVLAIAHGNYAGVYPPPRDRAEVMRGLGLDPARPVVCCVGIIRAYKGLDLACDAVRRLNGAVQLAICGVPKAKSEVAELKGMMAGVPGVLVDRALSDQEFSDVIAASEAVLLPYRNITGSGSLLAALTLGRGVVASDLPLFREMLQPEPTAARLFEAGDAASLAAAIESYLRVSPRERSEAALRLAKRYDWERTVEPLVDVFRSWTSRPTGA